MTKLGYECSANSRSNIADVSMQIYFKPELIGDLKRRVFRSIEEITEKMS
jgi:hypothetical protein